MNRWPNFFIVGAPRAGTTSLYEYLKKTKGVYLPYIKEANYFTASINPDLLMMQIISDKKKYLDLFKDVKDEIAIGDSSGLYLWDPKAPKLIHDVAPNAKIIILLRDPIERAYSHFLKLVSFGQDSHPFSESIKKALKAPPDYSGRVVECGLYYEQVKRYVNLFGKDQVKIYIYEEFFKDPRSYVKEILEFLGINEEPPSSVGEIHNPLIEPRGKIAKKIMQSKLMKKAGKKILPKSAGPSLKIIFGKKTKKPPMQGEAKKLLEEIYNDDVKKLENLLGRSLPWDIAKKP